MEEDACEGLHNLSISEESTLAQCIQEKYSWLILQSKELVSKGNVQEALKLNQKAYRLCPSEKLQRKIQRMQAYVKENSNEIDHTESTDRSSVKSSRIERSSSSSSNNGGLSSDPSPKSSDPSPHSTGPSSLASPSQQALQSLSEEDQVQYAMLISEARQLVEKKDIPQALHLNRKALKILPSEKLQRKIQRMEMYIQQNNLSEVSQSSDENSDEKMSSLKSGSTTSVSTVDEKSGENSEEADSAKYARLISEAKELTSDGEVKAALDLYKEAAKICPSEKLTRKMERMEEYLRQSGIPIDDEDKKDMECEEPEPVCENEPPTQDKTPLTERAPPQDRIPPVDKAPPQDRIPSVDSTPLASRDRDVTSLSEEDQVQFLTLVSGAKEEMRQGRAAEALRSYKQAAQIYPSDKLQSKIQKLEAFLKESQTSNETSNVNHVNSPKRTPSRRPSGNNQSGSLSMDQQRKYNDLVMKAKTLATNGSIREALECNKKALAICFSEKLNKRIQKMESYLASNDDDEGEEGENGGMVPLGNGFYLFKDLMKNLYAHQKEGVLWMWGLHQKRKGGILGDDMGLGKTIQVISFLSGLFDMEKVHSVLIVMPVSVIGNWEKEFGKWAPGIKVESYHGSKKEKERSLAKIRRKGGVLLTSYGLVVTSWEMMSQQDGRPFRWDYLILDEGHKIKNPTKTTKGVHQIPAAHRILLTGTPIQNNLREMWSLFDFVHQGTLLGTARTFKMEYENPITRARERDATANERRLGMEMAESLKQIISPYFLRRTKAEVANKEEESEGDLNTSASRKTLNYGKDLRMPSMTRKNDFIIWLFLTPDQQRIYGDFLSLDSVKELLMTKKSPLVALTVLKKICDHPRLLSRRACAQLGLDGEHGLNDSALESEEGHQCAANQIKNMPDNVLIQESGKLIVIMDLLDQMKREGHRCLVFSQSRKMLDIIYQLINNRGHKVMRLDGTVTQLSERDKRIATFQEDLSYSVFLLTTQVGGVGLTLTAADRVIIYDPSWNPATDAQAVDRVFRIGQDKNVVIYRLITCGTVEEKIYRRQIFKDSITRQTTGNTKNPYRYFTKQELKELFTLDNPRISKTQQQLEEMHSQQRKTDSSLDAHIAFLYSLDIFGISDHDLMFTQEKCDFEDEGEAEVDPGTDYIQHRVQKAKELLQMESDLTQDFEQRSGKYPRNVPSEESGSQKPFSRPWGDWNLQGTVHSQEEGEEDVKDVQEVDIDAEGNSEEEEEDEEDDVQEVKRELETSHIDLVTPEPTPVKASAVVDLTASATKPTARIKLEPESPMSVIKREAEDQEEIQMEDVSPVPNLEKAEESEEEVQAIERIENLSIQASPTSTSKTNQSVTENEDLQSSSHEEVMQIGQQEELSDETENYDHSITEKSGSDKMEESIMVSEDEENKENVPLSQIIATAKRSSDSFKLNRSVDGQPRSPLAPIILSPVVTDSPAKKKPRRSVSQSPWLKHSPAKKDVKVVREEEVFISPDRFRPLMGTTSKGLQEKFKSRSNLNSTILSAFSDSPQSPYSSIRKETFNDSPLEGKRVTSRLQETLVEESPDRLGASAGLQTSFVPNSLDNTPNVSLSAKNISKDSSIAIGETDDESSPQKSLTVSKSDSVVESSILDEEEDEQVDDSDPLDDQSEVDIDSDDNDLPSLSVKKKKVRKAVIISDSESENNDENYEEEVEEAMDSVQKENRKKRKSSESNSLPQSKYAMLSSSDNEQSEDQEDMRSNEGSVDDEESIDIDVDSEDEDFQELPEELQDQYCLATRKAKELYKSCMYEECLVYVLQALEIYPENTALQAFALQVHSKKDQ
uniref:DNA excision repair protein ERCC-6-like isoform X4 n=1 Tax=Crassostrea virginica TaxID=6565 RepID=A0A8B8ETI6_CRAVI|nr:DNA excision repair protein ERCC-6-like isoform X4 [Crassostrea virginica]